VRGRAAGVCSGSEGSETWSEPGRWNDQTLITFSYARFTSILTLAVGRHEGATSRVSKLLGHYIEYDEYVTLEFGTLDGSVRVLRTA
jgi:hypothetical protein